MERRTHVSAPIPGRGDRKETISPEMTGPDVKITFSAAEFHEVEYELRGSTAIGGSWRSGSAPAVSAQPIGRRAINPVREKFNLMRRFSQVYPPDWKNDALFYEQAKFMEDFSDDFHGDVQFSMYYPCYQQMGFEQLRTYFTWRGKTRRGEILPTSTSYVFLYFFELLGGIGVNDPADGLNKLMRFWNSYRKHDPLFDGCLPRWLKDYHIYYKLPRSFEDFVREHNLYCYYPEMFLFLPGVPDRLALWNRLSAYDVTKSKFYTAENETLHRECFDSVLSGMEEFCARRNARLEDLFCFRINAKSTWYHAWKPFKDALFHDWLKQPDRTVKMPGGEIYVCKKNHWRASTLNTETWRNQLISYLIKKMESDLRRAVSFKYKLTAKPGAFVNELSRMGIRIGDFDKAIEGAVAGFHESTTRTVVIVDHSSLERIRKEAQGTQDKLIIPDQAGPPSGAQPSTPDSQLHPTPHNSHLSSPLPPPDEWIALEDDLSATEREALSILLRGGMDSGMEIKSFADENGVMLEVLIGGVNEKAADHIGDCIVEIDGSVSIYDEYRDKVEKMVKGYG